MTKITQFLDNPGDVGMAWAILGDLEGQLLVAVLVIGLLSLLAMGMCYVDDEEDPTDVNSKDEDEN